MKFIIFDFQVMPISSSIMIVKFIEPPLFSQGLGSNILGYEVALCLYEREAGPHPKKAHHVCFRKSVGLYRTIKTES